MLYVQKMLGSQGYFGFLLLGGSLHRPQAKGKEKNTTSDKGFQIRELEINLRFALPLAQARAFPARGAAEL